MLALWLRCSPLMSSLSSSLLSSPTADSTCQKEYEAEISSMSKIYAKDRILSNQGAATSFRTFRRILSKRNPIKSSQGVRLFMALAFD